MGRLSVFLLGSFPFLLAIFAFPGAPQQPQFPQAQKAIQVESDLVVVDATVRDRRGNLVSHLKREEFKIFEDHVPQDLVTFAVENIPVGPSQAAAAPAMAPVAPAAATPPATAALAVVNLSLKTDEPVKKEDLDQQERDLQLQQALSVDRPFNDLPLILQADYFGMDDKTSIVPVSIELDGDNVTFGEKGANRQARFEFLAQVVDPKGKISAVARDDVQVSVPADKVEKIKAGELIAKPWNYRKLEKG